MGLVGYALPHAEIDSRGILEVTVATGSAALLQNASDLFRLAAEYDDHTAAVIVAKEAKARGHDVSVADMHGALKMARIFLTDGAIVSDARSNAHKRVQILVDRTFKADALTED